jgi:hypothetical protein
LDTLKASLKDESSPLAGHVSGPVVAWYFDDGVGYTLCPDTATQQAPSWEKEFRQGIYVCRSDEETPPLALCVSVADQRAIALAFDETTSRLVGMARGPIGAMPAYRAWFAKLHGATEACTSAKP